MTPSLCPAGPFSSRRGSDEDATGGSAPVKSKNQKTAEDIAAALKRANFRGYEIDIEYKDGIATLKGKVSDPRQKGRANDVVSSVPGVRRVDNRIVVVAARGGQIRQTAGMDAEAAPTVLPAGMTEAVQTNQEKAMEIGRTLQNAGLTGYDIEVMYQNGQALLRGSVATPQQRAAASQIAGSVSGVRAVSNELRVEGGQAPQRGMQQAAMQRYRMAAYQEAAGVPGGPAGPAGPPTGSPGGPMAGPGPMMGAPMPATGPAPSSPVYDNPNLPDYAWPAMAQHPNYAAVTYPSQYSASAWPYIGPFYPYPQVPLNWRKVTLEWDDGNWDLKFDSRTDRWWWFMNPKNW